MAGRQPSSVTARVAPTAALPIAAGQILNQLEVLRRPESASTAHDHRRLAEVELGPAAMVSSVTTTRADAGSIAGAADSDFRGLRLIRPG